ncbi:hypothetical protein [Fodinicola acaciae]|uniref:hypothetical protein n=1 Tax=Fodinicola acaciae TaxID=2681555 RepID=UPI0013D2B59F|nr:hypothetical protein [Fodinicola acaciae]
MSVAGRKRLVFGLAVAVAAIVAGVAVYFGVFRAGAASHTVTPAAPPVITPSSHPSSSAKPGDTPSPGQIEASLGLPTSDDAGDVNPAATPGLAGASLMETTARVFAARFSVYAPLSNSSTSEWVASWSPIVVPSFANSATDLVLQYYKFTSDQGVKTTNPRVVSAAHVWSGQAPDGPQQLWRVTVQRTLVPIDGSTRANTEQTVLWDIELRDVPKPLVVFVMTGDPHRTAPPQEN